MLRLTCLPLLILLSLLFVAASTTSNPVELSSSVYRAEETESPAPVQSATVSASPSSQIPSAADPGIANGNASDPEETSSPDDSEDPVEPPPSASPSPSNPIVTVKPGDGSGGGDDKSDPDSTTGSGSKDNGDTTDTGDDKDKKDKKDKKKPKGDDGDGDSTATPSPSANPAVPSPSDGGNTNGSKDPDATNGNGNDGDGQPSDGPTNGGTSPPPASTNPTSSNGDNGVVGSTAASAGQNESGDPNEGGLSTAAIIGIGVGCGVVALAAVLGLVFFIVKRRPSHNDSYYRFTDPESPGDGGSPLPSGGDSQGPTTAPSTVPAAPTAAVGVGMAGAQPEVTGNNQTDASHPHFVAANVQNEGEVDRIEEPVYPVVAGPTAPSASEFTRRDSEASSQSSDTIVAPIYRQGFTSTTTTNTSAAAPWFHTGGRPK